MLRITPEAGLAIQKLTATQGASPDGGLRIDTMSTSDAGRPEFGVSVATAAGEQDRVSVEETTGARVLLDSSTARILEDATLDVDDTVESQPRFRIVPNVAE
jgi:Fe-S cluster assembly iron-binding protein IscA